jgi:uncharacterized membrane protein HdeD (DUF308 family)
MEDIVTGNSTALALRALVAILFGIIALAMPGPTVIAVVTVFAIYAIVDGVLSIIAAVRGFRRHERVWALLLQGILGIVAGVLAFLWPGLGALALTYIVAAWALTTGILEIVAAVKLRKVITGEWMLILGGVLSVILGVMLAILPGIGVVVLVWWLGAYALAYGIIGLVLAVRVRRWARAHAHA